MADDKKLIVLAIGGNSLIKDKNHTGIEDQYATANETAGIIVDLLKEGHRVVVTHGNGPQVGFILRRAELALNELHRLPLDYCGADSQGAIGYMMQRALNNHMKGWEKPIPAATVVTQVLVDENDPAYQNPAKPIGSFMEEAQALKHREEDGWAVVEDAGRGWRRVVASPRPKEIIELEPIKTLIDAGYVVVSVGGGGIPVTKDANGDLQGSEAVIDKDLATSLLARELNADLLLISTAVEKAFLNFGKEDEKALDSMTVAEAKQFIDEGHFAPGSMLPKVKAMIEFVEATGTEALLTDPGNIRDAVAGKTGTRIVP